MVRPLSFSIFWLAMAGVQLLASPGAARADDWPQWLGARRDGVWRESGVVDRFPPGGPRVRWRVSVAGGYAGPAVADGRVFVTDRVATPGAKPAPNATGRREQAGKERVLCFRESDGTPLWTHEYDCPYGIDYGAGPRATPVVDGGRVYTLGAEGHLLCLDATTGKVHWSVRTAGGEEAPVPTWGMAAHPLVDGDKVIALTARKGAVAAAFDKRTGEPRWTALSARSPGYCPPTIVRAAGVRQLIIWHPESINGLDPETGKVYWSVPFGPVEYDVSIATPRHFRDEKHGDLLLVSNAWDGTMVVKLGRDAQKSVPTASVLWQRDAGRGGRGAGGLHVVMAPPMVLGGHVYGINHYGQLRCLDATSGDVKWETLAATTGTEEPAVNANAFIIPHLPAETPGEGFKAFLANELGDLIIARLSPKGYEEVSRARLLAPTNTDAGRPVLWCHPAFANRCVYWRNDKELICVSLAEEQ